MMNPSESNNRKKTLKIKSNEVAKTDSNEVININSNEGIKIGPFNEERAKSYFERVTRSSAKGINISHQSFISEDVRNDDELRLARQTEINRIIAGKFDEAIEYEEKLSKNVRYMNALKKGHGTDAIQMSNSDSLYRKHTKNSHSNLS